MKRKTTDPKDYIELLEVFRIALINGIIDKEEIVKWADEIIQQDDEPDYFIVELALSQSKGKYETISILKEYVGENESSVPYRVILGFLYNQFVNLRIDLGIVASSLYWVSWKNGELNDKDKGVLYGLDDVYELGESIEDIRLEILEILKMYKDFTIENFEQWASINADVELRVDNFIKKKEMK